MSPHDPSTASIDIKPRSRVVTDGIEATTSRGMLRAVGMGDADWDKPQIGIASSWNEITPCNLSLDRLAQGAKEGVHAGRRIPAAVRHDLGLGRHLDGSRGHALLARVARGHRRLGRDRHDGRAPRRLRAARRLRQVDPRHADGQRPPRPLERLPLRRIDRARAGSSSADGTEKDITIIDSFEARRRVPRRPDERGRPQAHRVRVRARRGRLRRHVHRQHDGVGRRGARASACPGSAAPPPADRRRDYYAHRSGEAVVNLLRPGITTRDILTKEAFENAIALAMALGGSTNVVLHLLAIAREAEVDLDAARLQPHRRQGAAHRPT